MTVTIFHDFLFLYLARSPILGRVTPKVKSIRKLSEDVVVTQKTQYKIQYKYSFSTILEYTLYNSAFFMSKLLRLRGGPCQVRRGAQKQVF